MNRILCHASRSRWSSSPSSLSLSICSLRRRLHQHHQQHQRQQRQQQHVQPKTRRRISTNTTTTATTTHTPTIAKPTHYPTLFSPITLPNGIVLPNRVLMGSMHTGLEGNSIPLWFQKYVLGIPLSSLDQSKNSLNAMATYFQERAQGGVGLMVTGGIAPNRSGWTGLGSAHLLSAKDRDAHTVVTEAVHNATMTTTTTTNMDDETTTMRSKICLQILHTGRYAYHPWAVSASSTKSPISPFTARALTIKEIYQTIDDFTRCATLARDVGYDGVEIMASEGYLLSQFLSPRTNHRTDAYGGPSLENRAKLPLQILQKIKSACGDDFIIIFRLSLLDLVDGGLTWEECIQMARWIEEAGATILNTGIGWHESRIPTIATCVPRAAFVAPTAALKATGLLSIPLVATNRINMPQVAEDILKSHEADMVSMARPFLADPNFLIKAREGRAEEINTCIGCNQACLDHAFVGKTASCLVNPRAGHETTLPVPTLLPPEDRRKLVVIGAGPAGCALSLVAAQRGHDVTLYDAQADLGGQFHMAKRIPGKEEFHETLRYFRTMLTKHNVQMKFHTTITKQDLDAQKHVVDKWIVATGVHPRKWNIKGSDHPNVLSYVDVLRHGVPVGKRVAIVSHILDYIQD
jgi:2,4-dienoyl-CoA reductase (NADPH2)